ncbi:CAP domain-containing protein [Paenibacillus antarcticus]|uniref:SCP domain-containing protein n=1 Tax=Paenibacillus antarcticus TaxID=253703 RepID=A0A168PJC2_9BACL|nr:CAP domain-containing protein [Paenibacillus antarcticus]OAB46819.1 hypothetical protein PBAT_09105 [Paenibacillus antarcticus]
MKKSMIKTVMAGTFASILAVGMVLPGSASATSAETYKFTDVKVILQDWIKNHDGEWKVIVDKLQTTIKPSTPITKPEVKPEVKPDTNADQSVTAQVVALVNQERSKAGLKPLTSDTKLANMALDKAKDMNNNNYFAHNSPTYGSPFDMMKQYGITYSYAGENIAKGQKTPADVMTAWMNSEGHRANILNANYTIIGVGYYNGHWVQEFISK